MRFPRSAQGPHRQEVWLLALTAIVMLGLFAIGWEAAPASTPLMPAVKTSALTRVGPSFSPDGQWVAFRADARTDGDVELFVAPAAGGSPVSVSRNGDRLGDVVRYAWSPDGSRLAFTADMGDNTVALYTVLPGGNDRIRISKRSPEVTVTSFEWSPDGSRLLFVANQDAKDDFELFIVSPTGEGVVKASGSLPPQSDVRAE